MSGITKQIARQRVHVLFELAERTLKANPQLSQRYIETARKIAMSARLGLPTVYTRKICKKCNMLLVAGESSRVRIKPHRESHVVITCLKCGSNKRIPLKPKNKVKVDDKKEKIELEQNNE